MRSTGAELTRLEAPRLPAEPAPYRFPLLATLAPVVASVGLWLVTGSLFALVFAGLAPITALGSLADARFGARRLRARELARFSDEAAVTRVAILTRHEQLRSSAVESAPSAHRIVRTSGSDPRRWRTDSSQPVLIALGFGRVLSPLALARAAESAGSDSAGTRATLDELARLASTIDGAPVVADARVGLGIVGPPAIAKAVARAFAVQVAWAFSPSAYWCWASDPLDRAGWLSYLPHRSQPGRAEVGSRYEFGRNGDTEPVVTIVFAANDIDLPPECGIVLRLDDSGARVVHHPDPDARGELRVEALSRVDAQLWAKQAGIQAARDGHTVPSLGIPASVALTGLLREAPSLAGTLACEFAVGQGEPVTIDLVTHGPHAVVGGTTGSGKSELLIAWVLAMAASNSPDAVNFLLVDFKGGSAFAALVDLPHTVGVITDLDETEAARALASLRAELRFREAALVRLGARSIDDATELPRLVIIVDEFAAMLAEHVELHALFSDLAARGRSLGVHLILCTQRPAGVVRDAVLANADLRISLRVNNRADSSAVVGTDEAASIPSGARGRGIVTLAGGTPQLVQFAIASAEDHVSVASLWAQSAHPRRPWCAPLPEVLELDALSNGGMGITFGLVDLPHEQRHAPARWQPDTDGHLLALGAPGSGKSQLLRTLAARSGLPATSVPATVDGAWDCVSELVAMLDSPMPGGQSARGAGERLVLLDDLDSLLARLPSDYRPAFVERLTRLARDGSVRGIRLAFTAQRLTAELQTLSSLVPSRLIMAQASRHDHVLAGGDGSHFTPLPPGGAIWRAHRAQVALGAPELVSSSPGEVDIAPAHVPLAIVTTRGAALTSRLLSARYTVMQLGSLPSEPRESLAQSSSTPVAIVGDVDEWQSRWGALAAVRSVATPLFDACSITDYRAITRSRELPPPLPHDPMIGWWWTESGEARRMRVPG